MKKIICSIALLLMTFFATTSVYALESNKEGNIINSKGVSITPEQYEKLSVLYKPGYIDRMSQDEFNRVKDKDYSLQNEKAIYIKSVIMHDPFSKNQSIVKEEVITKEEYDNPTNIGIMSDCSYPGADTRLCWETTYKKLWIGLYSAGGVNDNTIYLTLTWKLMPAVRSNDVIALRYEGFTRNPNTETGYMVYKRSAYPNTEYWTNLDYTSYRFKGSINGSAFTFKLPTYSDMNYLEVGMYGNGAITDWNTLMVYDHL